jgi:CYTH domain-containing protein
MGNKQKLEIERKYLLTKIPDRLDEYNHIEIEQGYISTVPVVRIRKKITHSRYEGVSESYVLTIKSSGMLKRQEYEMDITADEYENLTKKVDGNIITKIRYIIPLSDMIGENPLAVGLVLELDIFKGIFDGLVMGEVEFPDEKTADSFESAGVLSDKLFKEVTFDRRFHNSVMSNMSNDDVEDFIKSLNHPF